MLYIPDDKPYQYAKQSSDVINISKAMANWVDRYTFTLSGIFIEHFARKI